MSERKPHCSKCGKPKTEKGPGSLTQWIAQCSCDVMPLENEQAFSVRMCQGCGKRISEGKREGSFTQWVFRSDLCQCERPQPVDGSPEQIVVSASETAIDVEEDEIEVDATNFPIDRYKPLSLIGLGASGDVYLCRDRLLGTRVAVKCLRYLDSPQLVAFQNEARATSSLNHSGIVTVLNFGVSMGGAPYMVMEFIDGISFEKYLDSHGPISIPLLIEITMQLCDALAYSHTKGILHRDIKPSNILLSGESRSPRASLIDFGTALISTKDQDTTIVDGRRLVGTPAYMPPEVVQGQDYDKRSEIYSLGCVMFEALTGRTPFSGATPLVVVRKHVKEVPPSLLTLIPETEFLPEINSVIETCLAKSPKERYMDLKALKRALKSIAGSDSPVETESQAVTVAQKQVVGVNATKVLILAAVVGALLIATSAIQLHSWFVSSPRTEKHLTELLNKTDSKDTEKRARTEFETIAKFSSVIEHKPGDYQILDGNDKSLIDLAAKLQSKHIDHVTFTKGAFTMNAMKPLQNVSIDYITFDEVEGNTIDRILSGLTVKTRLKRLHAKYCMPGGEVQVHQILLRQPLKEMVVLYGDTFIGPNLAAFLKLITSTSLETIVFREKGGDINTPRYPRDVTQSYLQMKKLTTLGINTDRLDSTAFDDLSKLKTLKHLILTGKRRIGRINVLSLLNSETLETIDIEGGCLGPQELTELIKSKRIRSLGLRHHSNTEADLNVLQHMPLVNLRIRESLINNMTFEYMSRMKSLRSITLDDDSWSKNVKILGEDLPTCKIMVDKSIPSTL